MQGGDISLVEYGRFREPVRKFLHARQIVVKKTPATVPNKEGGNISPCGKFTVCYGFRNDRRLAVRQVGCVICFLIVY